MVFYYQISDPDYIVYMGKDKYENEDLIKWGWPEDVWFHVDNLSSAHVYLRLKKGETMNDIPQRVMEECCQLTKNNSIQGCKENNVSIIYTPWANLKKTRDMEPGQVMYHDESQVKYVKNVKKVAIVINRLEKTKEWREVLLREERERRDKEERFTHRTAAAEVKKAELEAQNQKKQQAEILHYTAVMKKENMKSNKYNSVDDDDFM
ncbi:coiled-coil domain-containing protein 25 [Cavenderia fasciculata]|uniref:Coiled-coil domain-containing protein 25 n=1 Tax=Cavenderia fasciculata TaxID=261658 RepID=F4QE85_CACFS|nr:coiled-coil domain-containing protein 25 [Cavenderia fasciculata]EGG14032.1 coiled-coil domain-containing protein 25 [Cavenderia fasciculata]|eukprot:XP_004350740.1 coiled-coil domain-containing protein 25 [Cavenderia fasciculata]